jgi:hypothetical protein
MTSYEDGEDGRRFGFGSCFNGLTAIWDKSDPVELQLQHPADWEPSVPADPATALIVVSASYEDIGPQPRLSFSAPYSRFKCRAVVLPWARRAPRVLLLVAQVRFASAGDDDIILTVDKIRENSRADSQVCVENLLARPFFWLGCRTHLLTETSQGSRLEVIIIDLEEPEIVVRLTSAESSGLFGAGLRWQRTGINDPWLQGVRRLSRMNWPLENSKGTEGSLEWFGKSSRCRRLLRGEYTSGFMGRTLDFYSCASLILEFIENALYDIRAAVLPIPDRYPVESILIELKRCKAQPLVTVIHGPHGQIPTAFTSTLAAYPLGGCTAPQILSL